jgi:ATP-dependent RNA helicase RhlE
MKFLDSDIEQNTFEEMQLAAGIGADLKRLGISKPTPIQKKALPRALAGSDMLAIAETGSGKTLAYGLAISTLLQKDPKARALVLTPSRETAEQIFQVLNSLLGDLKISRLQVVAGMPDRKQVTELNKLPRLIVATPGRLTDQLSSNKLLLQNTRIMVIDECDRMLDKGFGPQLRAIKTTMRGEIQTLMFGASTNEKALKFAEPFFRQEAYIVRSAGAEKPVETLKQTIIYLDAAQKKEQLLRLVKKSKGRTVIFVKDQPNCEEVFEHLSAYDFTLDVIHGGLAISHRQQVVKRFREGQFEILVTTDLLARGLDVPNIEYVFNYDLPAMHEDYLHRIGRTARAGQAGVAITFVTPADEELEFDKFKPYIVGAEEIHLNSAQLK